MPASSDPILLTPGPLTTSMQTKQAMLKDWGSWDGDFNAITTRLRERLVGIAHGQGTHECVPLQGSGTFSVEAALDCAVEQYLQEGGLAARGSRYAHNCKTLLAGMHKLGFKSYVAPAIQAPIIVTFHAPHDANYDFKKFYQEVKKRGYLLYPGKLTTVETFRVGCIGHFGEAGILGAIAAIAETLKAMGIQTEALATSV